MMREQEFRSKRERLVEGLAREAAALRDIKSKLDTIFGAMADGFIVIDESGEVHHFTAGAEKLFGWRAQEVIGQNVRMLMPSPYREAHDGYLSAYLRTGVKKIIGIGREVTGLRKDGTTFPLYLSIGEIWLDERRYFVGVTHDLTRLKRAEERLVTLSAAVEQSPAAVMIASRSGRIEYVNKRFTQLTGYSAEELIGRTPSVLHSEHTPSTQHRRLWETIQRGEEWRGEIEDRRKNGELYWALETITPLHDRQGNVTHYLAIQQDITAQKRDKEALAESEQRFRQVAEMAGEWLWEQDPQGCYTYSSGAVGDILGLTPEEVVGRCYMDLLTEDSPEQRDLAMKGRRARAFRRIVNHYRHRDGHKVFTESTGAPIFDETGRLIKWRGVDHDITSHKLYEDALRVRDRAIESVHIGIVISDAEAPGHPNIYVNPALCEMTGYTREELLGHSMKLLQGPETDPAAVEDIRRALARGESCEVTLKNYRKGGQPFWNELMISPVVDENGRITHYIGIQTDVTERRRAEESRHELEIARHIQLSLLPSAPLRLSHAELAGVCMPAAQVGGDYFDYFHNAGAVDIVIADVSGHSVGAALIMTEVRSTLRAETRKTTGAGPAQVLRDLNELLHQDLTRADLFITMFYFRFLPEQRLLKYANAGHNSALLLRAGANVCTLLDADGLVLGVKRAVKFEERSVALHPGDKLLFYTDGMIEAQNRAGEFFGTDRLCDVFIRNRELAPDALIRRLVSEIAGFCAGAPPEDDIAMVIMNVS